MSAAKPIEDIYPLTPMQAGMLFHALYAPESGMYVQQVSATLRGPLEARAFRQAWQDVVDRHTILRTAFGWERRPDPFQVVYRQAVLPWIEHDWRSRNEAEREPALQALLLADRIEGFRLDRPPLMRLTVIRLEGERHQIVWTHHHLVLDGWSVPLVLREVLALYDDARLHGRLADLGPARPFREFIGWLKAQDGRQAEQFWTGQLEGLAGATRLAGTAPAHRGPQAGRDTVGAGEIVHRVPEPQTAALTAFARDQRVTLNTVVLAAWAMVLGARSGEQDVVFGATVSGRPPDLAQSDRMVGMFINTLPVRIDVRPDVSVSAWLRKVQERQAAQRRFEHTPLVSIHGWTGLPRDAALIDTLFVFENYPVDPAGTSQLGDLTVEHAHIVEHTNYSLTLVVVPGRELVLKADFDRGRFDACEVERLLDHLEEILAGMTVQPGAALETLPTLTREERRQVLGEWRGEHDPLADALPVHARFEAQVRRTPDRVAVRCGTAALTYRELNLKANRLARRLADAGVGPEVRVGVAVPPSVEMVAAVLAVLKTGGAYVPIAPSDPEPRRRFVEDNAGVRVVLTARPIDGGVGARALPLVMAVDEGGDGLASTPLGDDHDDLGVAVDGDTLAYVIYTSGSTGRPKGVMISHRGLANYLEWSTRFYDAAGGAGAPVHTPLGFDLTITSLCPPLMVGGTVDVIEQAAGLDGLAAALGADPGYSLIKVTPAHLDALRYLMPAASAGNAARTFVIGGEALLDESLQFWRDHAGATRLINEYGPTETVVGCCIHDATQPSNGAVVPIGRPIANTELFILDRALRPAPAGVAGELYIGGAGVARGYQGRPDLTAERFVPHPFTDRAGERLYRSGDLARSRSDGTIEFLGRIDGQIKLRGFRIELSEIEAVLRRHPAVADCAVIVQTVRPGDRRLIAFVAPRRQWDAALARELRDLSARELPDYMMPASLEPVDALPLTRNGKVDRQALERRLSANGRAGAGPSRASAAAPRGPIEELLAVIWREVLGVAVVGRDDTFFELGGHSLIATQIVARIRSRFQVDLPLRTLFEAPTVARLARAIDGRHRREVRLYDREPTRRSDQADPPLSFAQQRLWFLSQLDPASPAYNVPFALSVTGGLDPDLFRASLERVIARHDVLRSRFGDVDGQPIQTIDPAGPADFRIEDLAGAEDAAWQDSELQRIGADEARRPFDLTRDRLLRVIVARLGAGRWVVFFTMHHVVCDAWSIGVLIRELAALFKAEDGDPALEPLPLQYADYAAWQRNVLEGPAYERQLAYWRSRLAGLPVLDLPTDRPRPAVPSLAGASRSFQLPPSLAAAADALGRAEGVTLYMLLLSGFAVLLGRYAGQDDVAIGTPAANRPFESLEGLIGLFTNTLVIRVDISGASTFRSLLRQVRATTLDAYAHQDLPFERLVDEIAPARSLGHHPLFQVMFTATDGSAEPLTLEGLTLTPLPTGAVASKFDLSLAMTREGEILTGTFEYSTELFDADTVQRLCTHLEVLLAQAVAAPDRRIDTLRLLSDGEQASLAAWSCTRADFGEPATVIDLFERQAERTPDRTAAVLDAERATYRELERRSNQLAHFLIADGVRDGDLVGLCLDRAVGLIVAMLAVLKSGAAYVPLDRSYPADRLRFMVEDARVRRVIADSDPDWLPPDGCRAIVLPRLGAVLDQQPSDPPRAHRSGDAAAYVIYTSGSTGTPKGAVIPHGALLNHMRWMQRAFPLTPDDGVLQKTPISFDASVWEFFAPLLTGARLVLARPGSHQDPAALVEVIRREGVTILQVVPSLLQLLADKDGLGRCPSLRRVFAGGEALTPALVERFFATSGAELHNLYGPTEVTIDSVAWSCTPSAGRRTVPIGRPVDNVTAYVVDGDFGLVPVGVSGELYLGGAGLARGYVGRPALTAERFVPDPFGEPGARVYRTGDRARWLADGSLEFLGRSDDQIKVRGFRIEPGEIEAALAEHDGVRDAVVVARADRDGGQRLIAYVGAAGAAIDGQALREFLRAKLPAHMVPSLFATLDALPRLPNGKIDRRRLPDPAPDAATATPYVAPHNDVESALAAIWGDVLGIPPIGVRSNVFELGADSILTLKVVSRARAAGLQVTPADVFLHQTVETLAAAASTMTSPAHGRESSDGPAALTPIQHWFFEQPLPERHFWNQAILLRVPGRVDVDLVGRAFDGVVAHHDALRLRFIAAPDGWRQEHGDAARVRVERIDLTGIAAADRPRAIADGSHRVQASMTLAAPPLLRAALFDCGPDQESRLLIAIHHLVVDGVSWEVLLEDLLRAYEQIGRGASVELAEPTMSFQGWTSRLERFAQSGEARRELTYWTTSRPGLQLPRDLAAPDDQNLEGEADHVERRLDAGETARLLHDVPPVYNTQIGDVLLTAVVEAVGGWTGERSLRVDLEGHGRDAIGSETDVSRTIGWFTTLYPVGLDLRGVAPGTAALQSIKEQLRAIPGRGAGYGVLRYMDPDPAVREVLAAQPRAEVNFNYLGQLGREARAAGFAAAPEPVGSVRALDAPRTHLLEIVASIVDGQLRIRWTYSRRFHRRDTIERIAARFEQALKDVVEQCLTPTAGGYTASDFDAVISGRDLDKLVARLRE